MKNGKKLKKILIDGPPIIIHRSIVDRYQERKYDIDETLAKLSELLFEFDKESRIILGIIAKHGPLNEKKIVELAFKKSHKVSRDVVRYRLSNVMNELNFLNIGIVTKKEGKKIGNIKTKTESLYHLTIKGLIASLAKTNFEGNYMVFRLKELFSHWVKSYNIPEFAIQLIKYNLALFMIKNVIEGSKLTGLNKIQANIYSMNFGDPLLSFDFPQQVDDKKLNEMLIEIRIWFHIYSQVLNKAISEVTKDGLIPATDKDKDSDVSLLVWKEPEMAYASNVLPDFIRNWYDQIERIQFEEIEKFNPHITPEEWEPENQQGEDIDLVACNVIAKRILKRNMIKTN